jgi:hypothetical protein
VNIGTQEILNILKIGGQCFEDENKKFMDLLCEFKDVFSWSYKDIYGFDPSIIQHAIPIKEGAKTVRHKQRPINPALEAMIRK